jgi:hypothetical protein
MICQITLFFKENVNLDTNKLFLVAESGFEPETFGL